MNGVVTNLPELIESTIIAYGINQGAPGTDGIDGVVGPIGPQGATGTKGSKGDQGVKGNTGATGLTGDTGPAGLQGLTGKSAYTSAIETGAFGGTEAEWATKMLMTYTIHEVDTKFSDVLDLISPNGTQYKIVVSNTGVLSTIEV